jgi:hypothetical protein
MKYLKMFEDLNETLYQEIQNMIDNNQFLKGKVKADNSTVFEAGDFILLLSDLTHITDAHVDETIPGSKFEKGVDLKKAIIGLVSNNKPTEMTKGFGPSESKVTNPEEAEKFKWLGLDSKTNVGVENVHKLEPNADEFKSMNVYTYKDSRGNEFNIKVKEGEGEKTNFLSFIGAKLGKLGDKSVLSVMTAFPGKNGAEVANRNDFMKQGYYFTTTSKDVIENSKGSVAESFNYKMKYLKFYEEFQEYSISWQGPTDELINQEMHELLNNCKFFFIAENFDKVFSKMPSFYFYIVKKYLKKETTDKEEIRNLVVGKNPDSIGMGPDMDGFKENPPADIKKEVFNLIKSGIIKDWSLDDVKQTGNMGDLTQVFGLNSGKGGFKGEISFQPGIEGIEDLRSRLKTDLAPNSEDMTNYLKTYDALVKNKSISLPAPFIINLKNDDKKPKPYHLVGGHKRTTIALQLGIPVKAWYIKF